MGATRARLLRLVAWLACFNVASPLHAVVAHRTSKLGVALGIELQKELATEGITSTLVAKGETRPHIRNKVSASPAVTHVFDLSADVETQSSLFLEVALKTPLDLWTAWALPSSQNKDLFERLQARWCAFDLATEVCVYGDGVKSVGLDWLCERVSKDKDVALPAGTTSFAHVQDVASMLSCVVGNEGKVEGAVLKCRGGEVSFDDLCDAVMEAFPRSTSKRLRLPKGRTTSLPLTPARTPDAGEMEARVVAATQRALGGQWRGPTRNVLADVGAYAAAFVSDGAFEIDEEEVEALAEAAAMETKISASKDGANSKKTLAKKASKDAAALDEAPAFASEAKPAKSAAADAKEASAKKAADLAAEMMQATAEARIAEAAEAAEAEASSKKAAVQAVQAELSSKKAEAAALSKKAHDYALQNAEAALAAEAETARTAELAAWKKAAEVIQAEKAAGLEKDKVAADAASSTQAAARDSHSRAAEESAALEKSAVAAAIEKAMSDLSKLEEAAIAAATAAAKTAELSAIKKAAEGAEAVVEAAAEAAAWEALKAAPVGEASTAAAPTPAAATPAASPAAASSKAYDEMTVADLKDVLR